MYILEWEESGQPIKEMARVTTKLAILNQAHNFRITAPGVEWKLQRIDDSEMEYIWLAKDGEGEVIGILSVRKLIQ